MSEDLILTKNCLCCNSVRPSRCVEGGVVNDWRFLVIVGRSSSSLMSQDSDQSHSTVEGCVCVCVCMRCDGVSTLVYVSVSTLSNAMRIKFGQQCHKDKSHSSC